MPGGCGLRFGGLLGSLWRWRITCTVYPDGSIFLFQLQ
nr:MAG TPA: hypothetical protein [Caudoviricetes sp.]